jgi:RNA polymerase sigma factor (sigma-70 family)
MTANDLDLLRQFARHRSQDAFTTLVNRHVNLVFSAALRQVRSPQLAEEVAQAVFADLARQAGDLKPDTVLTAWLYQVARRQAVDVVRREARRQLREQIATEMNAMNASTADWTHIEPLLDEAMDALDDTDRTAVLLRYFENKSLREVGAAIGVGDDAAQKRVSRAVERLREFFTKRGVTIGASGLAVLLSANAVQSAPVGLAATIAATAVLAGTVVQTSTVIAATKTIAMTTLQKTAITAALAAAVGTGIFEAHQSSQLRQQNQALQQEQSLLAAQLQQLQQEHGDLTNRLASLLAENRGLNSGRNATELLKLRGEVARLQNAANDSTDAAAKALVDKVNRLKLRLEQTPGAKIPELQFLTDQDWIRAASGNLDSDMDYRMALSALRSAGENKFAAELQPALNQYMKANNGQFPTDLSQLQSYFTSPVDDAILQRWEITSPNTVVNIGVGKAGIITETAAVDDVFDTRIAVGSDGYGNVDFLTTETQDLLVPVYKAYLAANNGQNPSDPSQLLPYATTPEQQSAVQKQALRASARRSPSASQ